MRRSSWNRVVMAATMGGAAMLGGCVVAPPATPVYSAYQAQRLQTVQFGTVTNVRPVDINANSGAPVGAIAGAVIGGILGNSIGHGDGRALGTVAGVVGGGLAGNAVQNAAAQRPGLEITVRLDDGRTVAIVQATTAEYFQRGDRVRVVSAGATSYVAH